MKYTITTRDTVLQPRHKEILDGLLLGDGSVLIQGTNKTPLFAIRTVEKECVDFICKILPLEWTTLGVRPAEKGMVLGRTVNFRESYLLHSLCDRALIEYRKKWYPVGTKIIPADINLTPTSVRWWFYGDGSTSFHKYRHVLKSGEVRFCRWVKLRLCTNSFSLSEVDMLIDKLGEIGLKFVREKAVERWVIASARKDTVRGFFEYIKESEILCYKYKWKEVQ